MEPVTRREREKSFYRFMLTGYDPMGIAVRFHAGVEMGVELAAAAAELQFAQAIADGDRMPDLLQPMGGG